MNTAELKKLAEAATPMQWVVDPSGKTISTEAVTDLAILNMANMRFGWGGSDFSTGQYRQANAEYIAAANPAAILELLAINAELVEALKLIAETDPVDAALDPQRAVRISSAALAKAEGGEL